MAMRRPLPRPASGIVPVMASLHGTTVIGVDFSSAPSDRKPITAAVGRIVAGRGAAVYELETVRLLASLDAFETFLRTPGPWLGGFDLPFGQARSLVEHEGWPTDWPAFVEFYCRQPRELLQATFRRWCDGRPAGDKFAWRRADRPAGSSPAMRWTNPPVAWMMHAGIGRMLAAGLVFPAHAHPRRLPRSPARRRIALEAYPAFTARRVVRGSYKSDAASGRTPERRAARRAIGAALAAGRAGLSVRLAASDVWRRRLAADCRGDLLDAVICGLQAAHAARAERYGLPTETDPLEGWIASVPAPAEPAAGAGGAEVSGRP